MVSLLRIDDQSYVFVSQKTNQEVILKIDSNLGDPEFRFNLAQKIANSISSGHRTKNIFLANRQWVISKESKTGKALKASSTITKMVHKSSGDNVLRFRVQEQGVRSPTGIHDAAIAQAERLKAKQTILKVNYANNSDVTKKEFEAQIRGKAKLEDRATSIFSDPFTKLATLAFQKFENEFTSKNYFDPENCDFVIVKQGNELLLVNKNNKEINNEKNSRAAVRHYKEYLIKMYGKEKIAYIEHLYHMNLDNAVALTPEHIYRFNLGVNNLEVHDIELFLNKCHRVLARTDPFTGDVFENLDRSIGDVFPEFTGREIYGLEKFSITTVGELRDWLYSLAPLSGEMKDLSPKQLQEIMTVFKLTPEELNNAFTGRRIYKFIVSGYTNAGTTDYKPWIDQQQLLQTIPKLETCRNELEFQEKLAFVIAKNVLVREHPTETFRVGAIIPGIRDADGSEHYYKVTNFISNSYGIVSLTLEKVCNDPNLQAVKVYRSTASSKYFLQAYESVLQDLFLISSPGYKGTGLSDAYEQEFFHKRSMPLWVGYLVLSKEESNLESRCEMLVNANQALLEDFELKHAPKDLKSIFKYNPFIEEILLSDEAFWGPVNTDVNSNLFDVICEIVTYIHSNKDMLPDKLREKKLATRFLNELRKVPLDKKALKLRHASTALEEELHAHILSTNHEFAAKLERKKFEKHIFNKLQELQNLAEQALAEGNLSEAEKILNRWEKTLRAYVEEQGEDLDDKISEGLTMTGHSLGGALVQSQFAYHITNQMRMPLPGQTISLYEFDGPGIEMDDNTFAKQLIFQHKELLKKLNIRFIETRRQETGDIVPMAGREHLFAANDLQEERQLEESGVLLLNQAVRQRLPHTKTATLAQAKFAHETQFGEGQRQRTFYDDLEPSGDYIETYYTPFIQKLFDHAGKFGSNPSEIKQNQRNFKKNLQKLWGIPSYGNVWTPDSVERLRTWAGPTIFLRKAIYDAITKDPTIPYQDENGVFAVTEKGVASMREQSFS